MQLSPSAGKRIYSSFIGSAAATGWSSSLLGIDNWIIRGLLLSKLFLLDPYQWNNLQSQIGIHNHHIISSYGEKKGFFSLHNESSPLKQVFDKYVQNIQRERNLITGVPLYLFLFLNKTFFPFHKGTVKSLMSDRGHKFGHCRIYLCTSSLRSDTADTFCFWGF